MKNLSEIRKKLKDCPDTGLAMASLLAASKVARYKNANAIFE